MTGSDRSSAGKVCDIYPPGKSPATYPKPARFHLSALGLHPEGSFDLHYVFPQRQSSRSATSRLDFSPRLAILKKMTPHLNARAYCSAHIARLQPADKTRFLQNEFGPWPF